ncbi:hypothetical protein [Rhodococcus koreensis]
MDEYGDPELDLDAAIADDTLRELLATLPTGEDAAETFAGVDVYAEVQAAISVAWSEGRPPSPDEFATDPATEEAWDTGNGPTDHPDPGDPGGHLTDPPEQDMPDIPWHARDGSNSAPPAGPGWEDTGGHAHDQSVVRSREWGTGVRERTP